METDTEQEKPASGQLFHQLSVAAGNPYDEHGLTIMNIAADGAVEAYCRREAVLTDAPKDKPSGDDARHYEGRLEEDVLKRLLAGLQKFPWDREFPARPGIPDEAIVTWTMQQNKENEQTLKVWIGEAESEPSLAPVFAALRAGLAKISDSALYL